MTDNRARELISRKDGSLIDQMLLESETRKEIDQKLVSAGWVVQNKAVAVKVTVASSD